MTPTGAAPWGFLAFLPRLVAVGRAHGYALAVHGSLARDFDIIAAPWTDDAVDADDLAEAIRSAVGGVRGDTVHERPHGRRGYVIHLGAGPYIDLSVMPRVPR